MGASLKYPRYYAAMGVYRGKPVILGGTDGSVKRNDGEMWNMDTETWEEADKLSLPTLSCMSASSQVSVSMFHISPSFLFTLPSVPPNITGFPLYTPMASLKYPRYY